MTRIAIYVPGRPVPQGSKTAFVNKKTGRAVVVDKDVRLPAWRMKITHAAIFAREQDPDVLLYPITSAVGIKVDFVLDRPKNHYGTGKNAAAVKPSSPRYPAVMPDLDKLLRAVFDALTDAHIWHDDAQVVWCQVAKHYVGSSPRWIQEGVVIELGEMS